LGCTEHGLRFATLAIFADRLFTDFSRGHCLAYAAKSLVARRPSNWPGGRPIANRAGHWDRRDERVCCCRYCHARFRKCRLHDDPATRGRSRGGRRVRCCRRWTRRSRYRCCCWSRNGTEHRPLRPLNSRMRAVAVHFTHRRKARADYCGSLASALRKLTIEGNGNPGLAFSGERRGGAPRFNSAGI
jgi:hypothetical protein